MIPWAALLGIWSVFSFFCFLVVLADSDNIENKPSHWLVLVFCIPGISIFLILAFILVAITWLFERLDNWWKERNNDG